MNLEFMESIDDYLQAHRYRLVNAILVYQNDELVVERYYNNFKASSRNNIKSVWKSILSIVLGICADKGYIKNADEPIANYFPQFNEGKHPHHGLITIHHLLTMTSGIRWEPGTHYYCPTMEKLRKSGDWVEYISNLDFSNKPGEKFIYKEWDVVLLSALINKACGGPAFDICNEYLYKPLGVESGKWPRTKCGVDYNIADGENDSDLSARDLAKIGRLMLCNGDWNGVRIVSEEYVKKSVTPDRANPGYGYLWWLSERGFHGYGFGGQELNIFPAKKIVAVVQATAPVSDLH